MSLLLTSLLLLTLSLLPSKCQESIYRLPTTILPVNYRLTLQPDIPQNTFQGTEFIQINITESYFDDIDGNFDVSFNYYPNNEMNIATVELQVDGTDTQTFGLEDDLVTNSITQIATATFDVPKTEIQTLVDEGDNIFTLYMVYTANIRGGQDLAGWYRSEYPYNGEVITNLVTQFQATDARSAFPCFDEPAFKATFDITFIGPADAVKLSNMPPIGDPIPVPGVCTWRGPEANGTNDACESITFETTPEMSTYLLAFVIGGYQFEESDTTDPVQRVYYPYTFEGEEARALFALENSVDILQYFGGEQGFNIPYSISDNDKLDSIAVSDFAAGAMENWGLIVYRTVRLLVDEEISSQASKSGQLLIIAHELAHQWFGNLVSPAWWDDLWLNEGFATYMAYYGGHWLEPEYNLNEGKLQAITQAMVDDSSVFTHSVQQEIEGDPTQILSSFSSITYQKGMGVINTIANVMGNTEFLSGITQYLTQYQFGVATSEELGEVLDTFSTTYPDISGLMNDLITQEGFPLITVNTTLTGNNDEDIIFYISQQRFVKQGPRFYDDPASIPFVTPEMVASFEEQLWRVPILPRDAFDEITPINGTEDGIMTSFELQSTNVRVKTGANVEYYLVNPVDGGSEQADALFNFFRVYYDDFSFQLIVDSWLSLGTENQFAIISDRYALMQSSYITVESYVDFIRDISNKMLSNLVKGGENIPDYPVFNIIIDSLIYIDDVFCELVFEDNTSDDRALRGYFRDLARTIIRRILNLLVRDMNRPFSDDDEFCPDQDDCNMLQSACLNALVRLNDRSVIAQAYNWFYLCPNRVCSNPSLCRGCTEPKIHNERLNINITEDVMQAFIAGVLSYNLNNANALDEIVNIDPDVDALYDKVNIEQQTYILNALGAVYEDPRNILMNKALDFIMSSKVRDNMKINALVGMKICTGRNKLWEYVTDGAVGETPFDQLFQGSGLFSQEPLTALANTFASAEKQEEVSAFFSEGNRVNAGTVRIVNQTSENIYSRFLWKNDTQPTFQTYLRQYIVDKLDTHYEIWQIVLVTVLCCAGLVLLVVVFWGASKPTSDRVAHHLSKKREKRDRRKSSGQSLQEQALTSSFGGQSLDRTLRTNTSDAQVPYQGPSGNQEIIEEQTQDSRYGSTGQVKDDKQTL